MVNCCSCRIWVSHSCFYEDFYFLGYNVGTALYWFRAWIILQLIRWRWLLLLNRGGFIHGIISQKKELFIMLLVCFHEPIPHAHLEVSLKSSWLTALCLTVLDGTAPQVVIQLYCFVCCYTSLVIGCFLAQPEVDVDLRNSMNLHRLSQNTSLIINKTFISCDLESPG